MTERNGWAYDAAVATTTGKGNDMHDRHDPDWRVACTAHGTEQAHARFLVWDAAQHGSAVTLSPTETADLWRSLLDDSRSYLAALEALRIERAALRAEILRATCKHCGSSGAAGKCATWCPETPRERAAGIA